MSEPSAESAAPAPEPRAGDRPEAPDWRRRIIVGAVAGILVVIAALVGAAFIPRWWAQRIGDQVDGSFSAGVGLGLFYGFVFTALGLLALWITFRRRRHWKIWLLGLVLAALLALPNLMTLGIVVGSGDAAHAGERILDVDAPGFRNSTLAGAVAAAIVIAGVWYLIGSRRRARRKVRAMSERQAAAAEDGGEAGTPR